MPSIAIIGAGPIGATLAHKLAGRGRVTEIRLIDDSGTIAQGKALDIRQSGPVEGTDASVSAFESIHAAAGSDVVAMADAASDGKEHSGEPALSIVRRLRDAGITAPLLFTGASQREAMKRAVTELHLPPGRVIGAAPLALESALRAFCAIVADQSGVEVSLGVVGLPPKHAVIAWQEGTIAGQPLASVMPAHEISALSAKIPGLWPPGPYALGSAAARVAEALCNGSRRRFSCFVDAGRGRIAAFSVELGREGVKRIIEPALTRQEQTALDNALDLS